MELDRFLNLLAASLGTLGSVYVLKSFLALTPRLAASLATPRWGFSLPVLDSLSTQRAESVVGAVAFLVALSLGVAGMAFAPDTILFPSRTIGVAVDLLVTAIALGVLILLTRRLKASHNLEARLVILEQQLDPIVNEKKYASAYIDALRESAVVLLGMTMPADATSLDVVKIVAARLGRSVPPDVEQALGIPAT